MSDIKATALALQKAVNDAKSVAVCTTYQTHQMPPI